MSDIREEFEAWAKGRFTTGVIGFGVKDNGEYLDLYTHFMYEGWKAVRASQWISVQSYKDIPIGNWLVWVPEDKNPIKTARIKANVSIIGDTFAFDRKPVKAYMPQPEKPND